MRKADWAHFMYKPVIVTRPDGTETEYMSMRHATDGEGIPQGYVSKLCNGRTPQWRGFRVRYKIPPCKVTTDT
jgi:hypothetical protein